MNTSMVEIRIHLPTGEVVTKTELSDVLTFPPVNLHVLQVAVFQGVEGAGEAKPVPVPPPLVCVVYRDDKDRSIWHRWYGAKLEIIEREMLIEPARPRLVT